MKYSKSEDGIERVSVRITVRLDRADVQAIKDHLKKDGRTVTDKDVREFVEYATEYFPPSRFSENESEDE